MNTVRFTVGLERGRYIQKQLADYPNGMKSNWKFETSTDSAGREWLSVEITDMNSFDALLIFHGGCDAGMAHMKRAFVEKS